MTAPIHARTVAEAVLAVCAERPRQIAVRDAAGELDYRDLAALTGAIAARLRERGVGPGDLVGVVASRDRRTVAAMLGVMAAGAAYVPLEPTWPSERLAAVAAEAALSCVLVPDPDDAGPELGIAGIEVDAVDPGDAVPALDVVPADLAYVIFTSGSTGRPKGVRVTHAGVLNLLAHMAVEPGLEPGQTMLGVTTPAFDLSVPDLYLPLVVGGTAVLAPRAACVDGVALRALLDATEPDLMQATPSTWRLLLAAGWPGRPALRIICGGEGYEAGLVREVAPRVHAMWNFYGPTETTVWSVAQRLLGDTEDPVPMGLPIRGTACRVERPDGSPTADGESGELVIGGLGVARGYLREDPARAFRPGDDGRLEFRTGDQVRRAADGRLTFVERLDGQIKIRGYRVELGEVEAAALARPDVGSAVAVHIPGETPAIVVFVTASAPDEPADPDAVLAALRAALPAYMAPALVVALEQFPLTPNAKVDRRALADDAARRLRHTLRAGAAAPAQREATPVEAELARLWSDVLGVVVSDVDEDFFALGGDSLAATRITGRIAQHLGVTVGVGELFEAPTVSRLALVLLERMLADLDDVDLDLAT